jgi:hypothetical protein
MKNGISEIIGSGVLAGDDQLVKVYRALRPLLCSGCVCLIQEGDLFTRRKLQGINLMPRCRQCSPFELNHASGRGEDLLDALLRPEAKKSSANVKQQEAIREMEKRIGPALLLAKRRPLTLNVVLAGNSYM